MTREGERRSLKPLRGDVTARARWLAARGRNAMRHHVRVAVLGTVTFVGLLVSLVLLPGSTNTMRAGLVLREGIQDTTPLVAAHERTQREYQNADSLLAEVRARLAAPPPTVVVRLSPVQRWTRDSLAQVAAVLSRMLARVENSPLSQTYRTLGESAPLRSDARVQQLLDSLAMIERERDAFGAVSGVDPMFVALTSRATAIGRTIQGIAESERTRARDEMARITQEAHDSAQLGQRLATDSAAALAQTPAPGSMTAALPVPGATAVSPMTSADSTGMTALAGTTPMTPSGVPLVDTMPFRARADTAGVMRERAASALAIARTFNADLERRARKARDEANTLAPPLAILVASLLLGLAFAFAVSLFLEAARPAVADAAEVERITGARVLAYVRPGERPEERDRRQVDLMAPPDIEPASRAYRAINLHLNARGSAVRHVTIVGDDAAIAAVVAANLAVIAATEARNTLLVDSDTAACGVSSILQLRPSPGTAEVLTRRAACSDVIITPDIGRDRMLDVVPAGGREIDKVDPSRAAEVRDELARIARRYDLCVVVAPLSLLADPSRAVMPPEDVLLCVRVAGTTLKTLAQLAAQARASSLRLRGIVLWRGESPALRTREEQTLIAMTAANTERVADTSSVSAR